jgi:lysophospholipase L1-like esterase
MKEHAPASTDRLHALILSAAIAALSSGVFAADVPAAPTAAPVPAAVAIPRPSASDVALVTESWNKFLAQSDQATKALLAKYPELVVVQAPRTNSAIVPSLPANFRARHDSYVEIAKKGDTDVLFMGDSITDMWRTPGRGDAPNPPMSGKAVFDKYYGGMKVANFGISGDTTQGVLYRLQNGEGQGFKPKVIMLMIGTNNTGRNSPPEIAEGIGAVVLEMRKDFPDAKILLLAVFPRSNPGDPVRGVIADINQRISKLDDGKNVFYLDIGAKFLDADGVISREIMSDLLHPTQRGYEIWAEAVKEPLAKLMAAASAVVK